jgi:hypothetical protein
MISPTVATGAPAPVAIADHRATVLTRRVAAVLAILRAQDLIRELGAADREYLAPYAAELLVDCTADVPPTA